MATSCLFAAAVIAVLSSTSSVRGHYGRHLHIIAPVSDNLENEKEIYWNLLPIASWYQGEGQKELIGVGSSIERKDYSDERLLGAGNWLTIQDLQYLEAENILARVDDVRSRDGRQNRNEPFEHTDGREDWRQHREYQQQIIENDQMQWKLKRGNKSLTRRYSFGNEQDFWNQYRQRKRVNVDKSVLEDMTTRLNRHRGNNILISNSYLLEVLGRLTKQEASDDGTWKRIRNKRSPKLTRAKLLKRQRRKKRRKEIRLQKKKTRIIKHDPEDENFVPSVEVREPRITYDYSTHEEQPRNDLDEEFVSKMPKRGELGEFGEGDTFENEDAAKEVTDDDDDEKKKKTKKKKGDDDKPKVKKSDKPKGGKKGGGAKGKRKGDKGKSKKIRGNKGGAKKGKKDKGKGKKKTAGRDTKVRQMLLNSNTNHGSINYGHLRSMDISRAFGGNRRDASIHNSGVDRSQPYLVGSAQVLSSVRKKDYAAAKHEREKVLADFRKIFGQKNTMKLLMDKHNDNYNYNNDNVLSSFANKGVMNKINTLNS